jgi:hypothetical protein
VLAVNTLCNNLQASKALAFQTIELGLDNVRDTFEKTGIIDVLGSIETQATETFWFLPIDVGLADAVDSTFEARLEGIQLLSQNKTRQFAKSLESVCDPFDDVFEKLKWCVIMALVALAGQILVLVSHHTQYTAWFYEVRLAHAESEAAGYERRVKLTVDYQDAKARATALHKGLPGEAVPVPIGYQTLAPPSLLKGGKEEKNIGNSKKGGGGEQKLPVVLSAAAPPVTSLVRVVYGEPSGKATKSPPPPTKTKKGSPEKDKRWKVGTAVAML